MNLRNPLATPVCGVLLLLLLSGCTSDIDTDADTDTKTNTTESSIAGDHDHSQHQHGNLDVSSFGEGHPVPKVAIAVTADAVSGWNIQIKLTNFVFAPEQVNKAPRPGEGHAHLYVDNYKLARLYGNWYHLKKLTPGEHRLRVTLNANDHSTLTVNGEVIDSEALITQD